MSVCNPVTASLGLGHPHNLLLGSEEHKRCDSESCVYGQFLQGKYGDMPLKTEGEVSRILKKNIYEAKLYELKPRQLVEDHQTSIGPLGWVVQAGHNHLELPFPQTPRNEATPYK